jgi:ankyrin repeat protein
MKVFLLTLYLLIFVGVFSAVSCVNSKADSALEVSNTNKNNSRQERCEALFYTKQDDIASNETSCYELQTKLYEAVLNNNLPEINDALLLGANVEAVIDNKYPVLQMAAIYGKTSAISLLINAGANVNREVGIGNTALKKAVAKNNKDAVKILLERGADVCNNKEISALQIAEQNKYEDIISTLKEAKADKCE